MKINYFNYKKFDGDYLLTNEQGNHIFLSESDFEKMISDHYAEIDANVIGELKDKLFIYDEDEDVFVERAASLYRDNKRYIFSATCLHIFVMTNACNMRCVYCQAQMPDQNKKGMMTEDVARKAVDIALQTPSNLVTFEFQGGEPLLNFDTIKYMVEYAEANKGTKDIIYTIVTNTLVLSDEMISFLKEYNFSVSTSLDGDYEIHNENRPDAAGDGTYDIVCSNIKRLREASISTGAIQTTTRTSLKKPEAIVEAYKSLGLNYLFLRPLTPLGYAYERWDEIGYTVSEFLEFYSKALAAIIECNRSGFRIIEGHAVIFLRKIIDLVSDNYMELRSPCGAGIGQLAYYFDGKIYTCDEGRMLSEMGLSDFQLGDVEGYSYDALMDSKTCKITCQASVLEGLPQCCDCVYHPFCGVCPVVNYALEGNIYSKNYSGYRCSVYKGILDILFLYIKEDPSALEIFKSWVWEA